MVSDDKISVIIPTYNREKLIVKSVKSVLRQTIKNIEVIVVDDGSSDNTEEALKKIKDKKLKYIKLSKNSGACKARNVGISESIDKYIVFHDSDDYYDIPNIEQEKILDFDRIIDFLCKGNFISAQAILAKRENFNDISFDEKLPRLQDYDLILRIASKYKISYTKEVLVDSYRQDYNISNNMKKLKKACYIMMKKDYEFNKEQNYNLYETFLYYILSSEISISNRRNQESSNNYENLNNEHSKLIADYNELSNALSETNENLQKVLNSKGWKLLEKLRKLR